MDGEGVDDSVRATPTTGLSLGNGPFPSTTLSYLSSRPEPRVGEGSAVRSTINQSKLETPPSPLLHQPDVFNSHKTVILPAPACRGSECTASARTFSQSYRSNGSSPGGMEQSRALHVSAG